MGTVDINKGQVHCITMTLHHHEWEEILPWLLYYSSKYFLRDLCENWQVQIDTYLSFRRPLKSYLGGVLRSTYFFLSASTQLQSRLSQILYKCLQQLHSQPSHWKSDSKYSGTSILPTMRMPIAISTEPTGP